MNKIYLKFPTIEDKNKFIEKLQIENAAYVLYSPDSLNYITNNMCQHLNEKLNNLNKLFNISTFRKIQINLFDNNEKFRNFIYELRGEKESLPEYASGTYDQGMINAFIENNIIINSPKYIKRTYLASHELFHIMYMELILKNNYSNRVVWFDEGMAQNFSGEKDYLLDIEKFKDYLTKVFNSTKIFPNLNEIKHGNSFYNENYNGYDLSYIAVRYLKDTLTDDELYRLMQDFDSIKELGTHIVDDAFKYYNQTLYKITGDNKCI